MLYLKTQENGGYILKNRFLKVVLLTMMVLFAVSGAAWGQGDGNGGGDQANSPGQAGNKPLSFLSATVDDRNLSGNESISGRPKITVKFDKNVVNMLIWERNSGCFSLKNAEGQSIAVEVT